MTAPRRVEVVATGVADTPEQAERMAAAGFGRQVLTPGPTWVDQDSKVAFDLVVGGDGGTDVDALLKQAFDRLAQAEPGLLDLRAAGFGVLVTVVLQLSDDDEVNPGFVLSTEQLAALARIGAEFQVAVYAV
ncbi:hypothetical protein BJP25_26610 [Actinokineospora bangkokensis]|uniref:DUF4279 domain-containing protein n=1 Tax=Actinokineospora bangkokensis TaxID=1193682 RepID=A0A1Q9LGS4_9PSEU|nr:hypothetical protein BJP25_26610 [Actinokineospora bangkokensis]